jgi:hypothetical protein
MDHAWIDIIEQQPEQLQRVLVKIIGGAVRLTNYDKYAYEHWCITHWKPVPKQEDGQKRV